MRSVYLGTSEFAATVLRALAAGGRKPSLVVTPPDRKRGRGRSVQPPPTAAAAAELGIELHQTADVNSDESRDAIRVADPGVAVVCAFGQLIREPLLSEVEMLNVHPSLLPRWRGAAPIERAIMAGDERTGVCIIRLTAGLDSGPVALSAETAIGESEDYGDLAATLAAESGKLMIEALDMHDEGRLTFTAQPDEGVTYAEKIEPGERQVDPGGSAASESGRVRALTPHIGAFAMLDGDARLGLRDATARADGPRQGEFAAGESSDLLLLGLAEGALGIATVQPAGKRWMSAGDYLRGYGLPAAASGNG